MPNRVIKESIRTSKSVNSLSDFQFRVWLYLITYVDDYGRGSADAELLKGFLLPRRKGVTESQIQKTLDDLANTGMIHLYKVGGEPFLCFPNWDMHQRIQTKKSKYPAPPDGITNKSTVTHGEPPPESNPNPNTNPNPNPDSKADKPPRTTFERPSLEEVAAYCSERNSPVDPQRFIDFYESNGWKVGKNPMRGWKATVRSWEAREKDNPRNPNNMAGMNFQPSSDRIARNSQRLKRLLEEEKQTGYQPTTERIKKNGEWLDEFLAGQQKEA